VLQSTVNLSVLPQGQAAELAVVLDADLPADNYAHKCRLWETWRALLWARSIENVVEPGGRGLAFVAAPEELL
jgi:hypothetical protein